ncbi:radical SAM protein [Seleniivibrio sp.]|uniref:radical SAM protein n=1 Tax=Seleniivibrio sp. TaxID=2898801 RepID=UPI0025FB1C3A|nr:radical SAM protein [Seleniivibrio sp.]MCD8552500.1 radical SAM protein [Seleniivibrio sp.]
MKCNVCEIGCSVSEGAGGACGRYTVENGKITELFPHSYLVVCPISAETMPVMNFYPGAKFLQISTSGCNFDCGGCVATVCAKEMNADSSAMKKLTPEQIIQKAFAQECAGIAFLMNDPLASFHTFLEVAKLAKNNGLLVGCSSNGYFTEDSLSGISDYLDFINIGIKGLNDADYRACGAPSYLPVMRNIRLFHEKGVHVEAACMHKKGGEETAVSIAQAVAAVSKEIPLQVMRFIPLDEADITDEPTIAESEALIERMKEILDYVYLFNSPGTDCINTYCPECGKLIFERDFYGPMGSKLRASHIGHDEKNCPKCGHALKLEGDVAKRSFNENDFEGGYPFTRALEIIEGTLAAIGVRDRKKIIKCWADTLNDGGLTRFHGNIQSFDKYADTIKYFGKLTGHVDGAERLVRYMRDKIDIISEGAAGAAYKPSVYYVMSSPLFALEPGRLENWLVEMAGGVSLNRGMDCEGRPGMRIKPERLNELNPDVIFISSFMHAELDDFYSLCDRHSIMTNAVENGRVYNHVAPCFDFGSPRWVLGLMHIANCLHPEVFGFDIKAEAKEFYALFYGIDFRAEDVNRSFAKPSRTWEYSMF